MILNSQALKIDFATSWWGGINSCQICVAAILVQLPTATTFVLAAQHGRRFACLERLGQLEIAALWDRKSVWIFPDNVGFANSKRNMLSQFYNMFWYLFISFTLRCPTYAYPIIAPLTLWKPWEAMATILKGFVVRLISYWQTWCRQVDTWSMIGCPVWRCLFVLPCVAALFGLPFLVVSCHVFIPILLHNIFRSCVVWHSPGQLKSQHTRLLTLFHCESHIFIEQVVS